MNSSTDPTSKVGYVRRAHGIKGALVLRVFDEEAFRFVPGARIATDNDVHPEVEIRSVQNHKDGLLVSLEGVTDRTTAEGLRGMSLLAPRRSLDPDEFWPEQLIGLAVVDPGGADLGVVSGLIAGGAQDRLVVATERGDREVPFVAALVTEVDVPGRKLVLDAPEGLLG